MPHQPRTEPFFDAGTLGRFRVALWLGCALVYVVTLVAGLTAGGTDLVVVGRALGSALAVGVFGRLAITFLEQARRVVEPGPESAPEYEQPSLADLLAPPSDGAVAEFETQPQYRESSSSNPAAAEALGESLFEGMPSENEARSA